MLILNIILYMNTEHCEWRRSEIFFFCSHSSIHPSSVTQSLFPPHTHSHSVTVIDCNERTNERTNERRRERTNERTNERTERRREPREMQSNSGAVRSSQGHVHVRSLSLHSLSCLCQQHNNSNASNNDAAATAVARQTQHRRLDGRDLIAYERTSVLTFVRQRASIEQWWSRHRRRC